MHVNFIYKDTDTRMEWFSIDVIPRVGDVVQFLNPVGHPLIVDSVYWQCFYAAGEMPSTASVQVNLRRMTVDEMKRHFP